MSLILTLQGAWDGKRVSFVSLGRELLQILDKPCCGLCPGRSPCKLVLAQLW